MGERWAARRCGCILTMCDCRMLAFTSPPRMRLTTVPGRAPGAPWLKTAVASGVR